jgi:hypothetical protein
MKTKWLLSLFAVCQVLQGCSAGRIVAVPGTDTYFTPGKTYVSAAEMKARGANSFGVPKSSFVFYNKNYVPDTENRAGRNYQEQLEYEKGLIAGGRNIHLSSKLRPANAPSWDRSYNDTESVSNDCMSIERLFVIPWGSGEGEIGMKQGSDVIWEPMPGFRKDGRVFIWDRADNDLLEYDFGGRLLSKTQNITSPPSEDWDRNKDDPEVMKILDQLDFMGGYWSGDVRTIPGRPEVIVVQKDHGRLVVGDYSSQKVTCITYLPPQQGQDVVLRLNPAEFRLPILHPKGFLLYPRSTNDGYEIYRYMRK